MRNVLRDEAEDLLLPDRRASRLSGATRVQQVRAEEILTGDEAGDHASAVWARHEQSEEVALSYAFEDGSRYSWRWNRPQVVRVGEALWCALPSQADVVSCVRATTILSEPEVLRSKKGSLLLLRSRFAELPAPILDAAIIEPADVTGGTGLSQEDARLVVRAQHASLVRRGRTTVWVTAGASLTAVLQLGPVLGPGLDYVTMGGAAAVVALPTLAAFTVDRLRARPRRLRLVDAIEADLEVVEVVSHTAFTLQVRKRDGECFSWSPDPDLRGMMPPRARLWATRLVDGELAHVVGVSPKDGRPVVLRPTSPATRVLPEADVQDVVRGE